LYRLRKEYGVDALTFGFPLPVHRTPLVSLKAVVSFSPIFRRLNGEPECDFARAIEDLEHMPANATAKLALSRIARPLDPAPLPAPAHDHNHPELDGWYQSLKSGKGRAATVPGAGIKALQEEYACHCTAIAATRSQL
jgi:hypothetical protein